MGTAVHAKFGGREGYWLPGKVTVVHGQGAISARTYDILYDNGVSETNLQFDLLRVPPAAAAAPHLAAAATADDDRIPLHKLYIPINQANCHWGACELDFEKRTISVMDSLPGHITWRAVTADYVEWLGDLEGTGAPGWTVEHVQVPKQAQGGNSCGIHTAYNMYIRSQGEGEFLRYPDVHLRGLLLASLRTRSIHI